MTGTAEQATQALAEIEQQAEHWRGQLAEREAALAHARESAGAEALADPSAEQRLTQRIVELSAAVDVARSAAETATGRVDPARRGLLRARAADLRERADHMRQAADWHWETTSRLLDQLREHEQADFVHFADDDPVARSMVGYQPRPPRGGLYGDLRLRTPVTLRLRGDADQLIAAAKELEQYAEAGNERDVANRCRRPAPEPSPVEREHVRA